MKRFKLKEIIKNEIFLFLKENNLTDEPAEESKKSINDEFSVSGVSLSRIENAIEKANKNLRSRNLKELKLNVLGSEKIEIPNPEYERQKQYSVEPMLVNPTIKVTVFKIKIDGEVPEIHDYEFIAKIEHTDAGNIINTNPKIDEKSLPDEYKTFSQRCDVCKSNRERLNTFILKKVETQEYMVAGSTCLKKFLPLDAVKAFLEYAVQLESLRRLIASEERDSYSDYSTGGPKEKQYVDPEQFLIYCCVAFLSNNSFYVSAKKAEEWHKPSTVQLAMQLMHPADYQKNDRRLYDELVQINKQYESEAITLARKILEWMKEFDYDEAAIKNPSMETYFHNLKVLSKLPYISPKNFGFYASFLAIYSREVRTKSDINQQFKKESNFVGDIGQKLQKNVIYKKATSFDGNYGTTYVLKFEDEDSNSLIWFTANPPFPIDDENKEFTIKFTVKAHQTNKYTHKKETIITRAKIV